MVLIGEFTVTTGRQKRSYLSRLRVGFLRKFVSVIGILQSPLEMQFPNSFSPFSLCSAAVRMSLRRKFVLLGGFFVRVVHVFLQREA